jgi:hypothetical protein
VKVFFIQNVSFCKSRISTYGNSEFCIQSCGRLARVIGVTDNGSRGQPACSEEWKMFKEECE